jgi:hypothetical protein
VTFCEQVLLLISINVRTYADAKAHQTKMFQQSYLKMITEFHIAIFSDHLRNIVEHLYSTC